MVIIFGGSGYVGKRFVKFLHDKHVQAVSRSDVNYHEPGVLRLLFKKNKPSFVINAAGFTGKPNVDACELERAETFFGNVVLPMRIGEACAEMGIPWGHVSSGCIYQGDKGVDANGEHIGFRENDEPNFTFKQGNCSFYSGTKALSEEWLLKGSQGAKQYIWRLRVPFDNHDSPRNFISKVMRYDRLLNIRNSLSHLDDFVASCWATFERDLPAGVYNVTNHGSVMTKEVVELIQEEGRARLKRGGKRAESMLKEYKYFESEEIFMTNVKTPRSSCVLDTTKALEYKLPLRPVREALRESLENWHWED